METDKANMSSDRQASVETTQRDELLQQAKEAAAAGDPTRMLEALYQGFVLDGLVRRTQSKWPSIPPDDIDYIVAEAVDVLYQAVRHGERVLNLVAYLWKVSDRKACDFHRRRQRERVLAPEEMERLADASGSIAPHSTLSDPNGEAAEEVEWEERRKRAVSIARELLPRLGQQNVQAVMAYVIDAVEAGREDLPNREIADALGLSLDTVRTSLSRGFRRLKRIAREEGLWKDGFDVGSLRTEDPDGDTDDQ